MIGAGTSTDRFCSPEIDIQRKARRLLDRQIIGLDATQQLGKLAAHDVSEQLNDRRPIADKAVLLRHFRPLVYGGQAQHRDTIKDDVAIDEQERDARTLSPRLLPNRWRSLYLHAGPRDGPKARRRVRKDMPHGRPLHLF